MTKPFYDYINNCVACEGCPKELGSIVCDILYWENYSGNRIDMGTAGRVVENVFYNLNKGDDFFRKVVDLLVEYKRRAKTYDTILHKYFDGKPFIW